MPRLGSLVATGAVAAALGVALAGQQAPPEFRANTALVPVDVRVVDKQGRPVTDLTQADFTITENGKPQDIVAFATQRMEPAALATAAPIRRRDSAADPLAPQPYRVFLILLGRADMVGCMFSRNALAPNCSFLQGVKNSLDGLDHFVRSDLHPQDYVAVMGYNRQTDFTTDHAAILGLLGRYRKMNQRIEVDLTMQETGLQAVYGKQEIWADTQKKIDQLFGADKALAVRRVVPPASDAFTKRADNQRKTIDNLQEAERTGSALDAVVAEARTRGVANQTTGPSATSTPDLDVYVNTSLRAAADLNNIYTAIEALRNLDGEKHLVFLSPGGIFFGSYEAAQNLARVASDARVVVDVIHTGGFMMSNFAKVEHSRLVATMSGGRFDANKNRYAAKDLDLIDQDTTFKYILGYRPANSTLDGRFRDIRVKINRPGLTVKSREGYYARPSMPAVALRDSTAYTRIASTAHFRNEVPDLKLQASVALTKRPAARALGELTADVKIDLAALQWEKNAAGQNTATIDVAVFCLDSKQRTVGEMWKMVELTFTDARLDFWQQSGGAPVQIAVPVAGTPVSVKLVAYQYAADLVGSRNLKVPPPTR